MIINFIGGPWDKQTISVLEEDIQSDIYRVAVMPEIKYSYKTGVAVSNLLYEHYTYKLHKVMPGVVFAVSKEDFEHPIDKLWEAYING